MSAVKLSSGSPQPPEVPGRVQLFGTDFNPYTQRVRMVLIARGVPHDVFNVDPRDKPEWYAGLQQQDRYPVLRADGKVLANDQDILKFLEEKFPRQPPTDPNHRDKHIELLTKFQVVQDNFISAIRDKDFKPSEKGREFFKEFEEELQRRGTTFLGGDTPGTADYYIWPWFERFLVPFKLHNIEFKPPQDRAPGKITAWREAMEKTKPVIETRHSVEEHVEACKRYLQK